MGLVTIGIERENDAIINSIIYEIISYALIGFNIKSNNMISFYYNFLLSDGNSIVVQTGFLAEDEKDLKFLKTPHNSKIDISKMKDEDDVNIKKVVAKIEEMINSGDVLFSTFTLDEESSYKKCIISLFGNINGKQVITQCKIPFEIYTQIALIKNQIINRLPISFSLDIHPAFNPSIELIEDCNLEYFGADYEKRDLIYLFFVLSTSKEKMGLISMVPSIKGKIVTDKGVSLDSFENLYKKFEIADLSRLFLYERYDKEYNINRWVCLCFTENDHIKIYKTKHSIEECVLFRPYDLIY